MSLMWMGTNYSSIIRAIGEIQVQEVVAEVVL